MGEDENRRKGEYGNMGIGEDEKVRIGEDKEKVRIGEDEKVRR